MWLPINTWLQGNHLRHQNIWLSTTLGCQVLNSFIMTTYIIHKLCQNELLIIQYRFICGYFGKQLQKKKISQLIT